MEYLLLVALVKSDGNTCYKELGAFWLKRLLLDQMKAEVSAGKQIDDKVDIVFILESKIDVDNELRGRIRLVNLL